MGSALESAILPGLEEKSSSLFVNVSLRWAASSELLCTEAHNMHIVHPVTEKPKASS